MDIFIPALTAGALLLPTVFLIMGLWWLIDTSFMRPLMVDDNYADFIIRAQFWSFWYIWLSTIVTAGWIVLGSIFSLASSVRSNLRLLAGLIVVTSVCFVWLAYHQDIVETYITLRQCYSRPVIDFFVLPVINILAIVYAGIIPFVNWYVNIEAFLWYGPFIIAFKCAFSTDNIGNLIGYFIEIIRAFFFDFEQFVGTNDFMFANWNILTFLFACGQFIDSVVPIAICFCSMLDFLFVYISFMAQEPSLHYFLNCAWNVAVRLLQLPYVTVFYSPHKPNLQNLTINACCAVISLGDAVEDSLYLIIEMLWGVITNSLIGVLPPEMLQFLSTHYTRVVTYPVCGVFKVVNMTNELLLHPTEFFACDGSGVAYLQFGFVFDDFRVAANAFGSMFYIISNEIQASVTQILLSAVSLVSFTVEWVIGNIFYFIYGGPLLPHYPGLPDLCSSGPFFNFFAYYFPNYWLTPNADVHLFFSDLYLTAEALGSVIASITTIFVPIGCALEHVLKLIIAVVEVLFNLFSFFWPVITFVPDIDTSFRAVNTDIVFNEMYYLAGCLGDLFRQFDGVPTCVTTPTDTQRNLVCSLGNLVETGFDVLIIAFQQVVHFIQDLVTLPTGLLFICIFGLHSPVNDPLCVRIPDFTFALFELNLALCYFADAVSNILPLVAFLTIFNCQFPPPPPPASNQPPQPPKPCNRINTCYATLSCNILQFLIIPLEIVNSFFVKTLQGSFFSGFTEFLNYAFDLIFRKFATILKQFGLNMDCVICALAAGGTNCDDPIYQIFATIADLLVKLAQIFTGLFISVVKLFLTLIAGIFGGDPLTAIVKFFVGFFVEVLGGLGTAVVNFLASLFDALGLGFFGSFIKLLWKGFCYIIQSVMNIVVIAIKAITFGIVQINTVDFCCGGGNCTPSGGSRKRRVNDGDQLNTPFYGFEDGVLYVNADNWLRHTIEDANMSWPAGDACNASMPLMAQQNFTSLSRFDKGHILFCFMKIYWTLRNDNQTELDPSKCDIMMDPLITQDWNDLRPSEKADVMECMTDRIYIDAMRIAFEIPWFPSDFLTNSMRKYFWAAEMTMGYIIYWQYWSDVQSTSAIVLSKTYQDKWKQFGLNVSHYDALHTPDDILIMRSRYHLKDYFEWNQNATQYEAVKYTTTSFWNAVHYVSVSLINTTFTFSDNVTDPSIYLDYDYTLDNEMSGFTSSVNTFLFQLLGGIRNVSEWWSNPDNVKKRGDAFEKVKNGSAIIYAGAARQLKMMALEWGKERTKEYQVYTASDPSQCNMSINETIEFMYQYEASLHGLDGNKGEKSLAYQLYVWWQGLSFERIFNVTPIANTRDRKYACKSCPDHDPDYDSFEHSRVFRHKGLADKSFHKRAEEELKRVRDKYRETRRRGMESNGFTSAAENTLEKTKNRILFSTQEEQDERDIYQHLLLNNTYIFARLNRFYNYFTLGTKESRERSNTLYSLYTSLKNQFYFAILSITFPQHEREMEMKRNMKKEKEAFMKANGFDMKNKKESKSNPIKQYDSSSSNIVFSSEEVDHVALLRSSLKRKVSDDGTPIRAAKRMRTLNCVNPNMHDMKSVRYNVSMIDLKCTPYHDESLKPSNYYATDHADHLKGLKFYIMGDDEEHDLYNLAHGIVSESSFKGQQGKPPHRFSVYKGGQSWVDRLSEHEAFERENANVAIDDVEYYSKPVQKASIVLAHIDSFVTLECTSNISGLCEECYYLDQLVGRCLCATNILLGFYTGGQFGTMLNNSIATFSYLFDPTAVVIVGDSPDNPLLWPRFDRSNFVYIGDHTPNKLRFNDLVNMTKSILNANSSLDYNNSALYLSNDMTSINGIVLYYYRLVFGSLINFFYNFLFVSSTATNTGEFFINWFILCDWCNGTDYLGTKKRFSVGESMFMYLVGFFLVWFVVVWTVGLDLLSIITGTSLSFMIFFFTYLSVTFNYSALCWPGLPVILLDDIRYFLIYTLFPKCSWFWSFLIVTPYNNDNCYTCSQASSVQMLNCGAYVGFKDIVSNIVLTLEYFAPEVLQWIRDSPWPFIHIPYQIPYVNERINQYYGYDFGNEFSFAQAMGCNFIVTLIPNVALVVVFFYGFSIFLLPLVTSAFQIFLLFPPLIYWMAVLMYYMLISFFITTNASAYARSGSAYNLPNDPITGRNPLKRRKNKASDEDEEEEEEGSSLNTRFSSKANNDYTLEMGDDSQETTRKRAMRTKNLRDYMDLETKPVKRKDHVVAVDKVNQYQSVQKFTFEKFTKDIKHLLSPSTDEEGEELKAFDKDK